MMHGGNRKMTIQEEQLARELFPGVSIDVVGNWIDDSMVASTLTRRQIVGDVVLVIIPKEVN